MIKSFICLHLYALLICSRAHLKTIRMADQRIPVTALACCTPSHIALPPCCRLSTLSTPSIAHEGTDTAALPHAYSHRPRPQSPRSVQTATGSSAQTTALACPGRTSLHATFAAELHTAFGWKRRPVRRVLDFPAASLQLSGAGSSIGCTGSCGRQPNPHGSRPGCISRPNSCTPVTWIVGISSACAKATKNKHSNVMPWRRQ